MNQDSEVAIMDPLELTKTVNYILSLTPAPTIMEIPAEGFDKESHFDACAMASLSEHLGEKDCTVLFSFSHWLQKFQKYSDSPTNLSGMSY